MDPKEDLLVLETRRRIYELVNRAPGLHLRRLQRDLAMPMGTLVYHLRQMERAGLVVTREDGQAKAFFANDSLDRRDRDLLYYLRQEMPRRIALEIVNQPGVSFQELGQRVPISPSTVSFHLKKLRASGIIEEQREGPHKTYVAADGERVRRLIVTYRPTFFDAVVDRFAEAWLDVEP